MSAAISELENPKAHLLVVDDEPEIRNVLHELLSGSYQCVVVASAEEALALLVERTFDLIISDITMELMSGLEMIAHALRLAPQTAIIMISGEQTIDYPIEALRAGAFDYIPKPFDLRQVEVIVRRALGHHNLLESRKLHEDHLRELVQQRTAEVERLAYYDTVTDLPNRALFEDRLAQALVVARSSGQMLGTLFLAFDRFKEINDTLGHSVGDLLLKQMAARLRSCVREGETVARFNGDEFALLLTQVRGTEDLIQISRAIDDALKPAFVLEGHELYVNASIGISLFPHDGEDLKTLLMNAGTALNRTQTRGGNNYRFYTSEMNARATMRLVLESSLRRAIQNEEFVVHYQPLVDIQSRMIVGAEALLRWQHPELGLLPPEIFISLAEETGSIIALGAWVLREACAQTRKWQAAGFAGLRIAVNVSPRQFQEKNLLETVVQTLQETGLASNCLELELTETSIMQNSEAAVETFTRLREMGVKIAIDDFGTGYSSLSYLKQLPIDSVKLDQSFVSGATTDPDDAALIMAIVTLAHKLRLKVVAEGVETEDQLSLLKLLRCDQGQGYLFGKPASATLIESLLARPSNSEIPGPLVFHSQVANPSLRCI
jgi:diguanylate cyclase (GGDEF)-like protein